MENPYSPPHAVVDSRSDKAAKAAVYLAKLSLQGAVAFAAALVMTVIGHHAKYGAVLSSPLELCESAGVVALVVVCAALFDTPTARFRFVARLGMSVACFLVSVLIAGWFGEAVGWMEGRTYTTDPHQNKRFILSLCTYGAVLLASRCILMSSLSARVANS